MVNSRMSRVGGPGRLLLALLTVLAMIAAACGGDDDAETTSGDDSQSDADGEGTDKDGDSDGDGDQGEGDEAEPPATVSELVFRLQEDPETLYNVNSSSITVDGVLGNYVLERLIYIDGEGQPQPWLAESWDVSDDQTEIVFELRDGVKFHDGTSFDAEAVKFHFDTILDPAAASPLLPIVGPITSVEVTDPMTVKFTFEEPFAAFFTNIASSNGGINSPTAVEAAGDEYGRRPVGSGPYIVDEWIPGSQIVLVRNEDYVQVRADAVNQGPPRAERIVLNVIPEDGVALSAMETGELTASGLQADTVDRFINDDNYNVVVDEIAQNLVFLEFNYQKAPFDDPEFRRALGHAVDRGAAVAAAWSGYASEALGPLAIGIPGYDQDVVDAGGTPYDPDTAAQMLADIGWVDSNDNGTIDKDGVEADFLFRSYAGFTHIDRTMEVIQSNFEDIGISVEIETADWGAFYPSLLEDDWDMDLMRWSWNDPVVLSDLFRSPGHREKLPANAALDDTLDRCNSTIDPAVRAECVSEAQALLLDDMIVVPVLTNWAMFATQGNVRDYTIDFLGYLIPGDVWLEG